MMFLYWFLNTCIHFFSCFQLFVLTGENAKDDYVESDDVDRNNVIVDEDNDKGQLSW